jgi:uncharacterized cupredoxin-like copper-binding protein
VRKLIITLTVAGLAAAFGVAPAAAGEGNLKKFCKTNIAINKAFNSESPNLEKVNRLLDTAAETAPPEIADAVDVAVPAFKEDPEAAFEDPAVEEAVGQIDEFAATSCGYEAIDVGLEDYAFTGLPDEIEKGTVAFTLMNEGAEAHEFFVLRLKGDATADDFADATEEELEELGTPVGGGFALPGETGYAIISFKKTGDYVAVCHIPVGSTDEAAAEAAEAAGAPSHASQGMVAEFEVT